MQWLVENWEIGTGVGIIVISEVLPFVKNTEANGMLQALVNILKRLKKGIPK